MARKQLPSEPPPERPFGQDWPRDREPVPRKTTKVTPTVPAESWVRRVCRLFWRRMLRPFLLWGARLVRRACDELLVFSLKAIALAMVVAALGGSIVALNNYSLRQIVNFVVVNLSKQHGIETGSIRTEQTMPAAAEAQQAPPGVPSVPPEKHAPSAAAKRRSALPKEKPWFDRLIDEIDEALGWKKT